MVKFKKNISVILLLLLLIFYISSIGFMLYTSGHTCPSHNCDICDYTLSLSIMMTDLLIALVFYMIALLFRFNVEVFDRIPVERTIYWSYNLIRLKVRLDC